MATFAWTCEPLPSTRVGDHRGRASSRSNRRLTAKLRVLMGNADGKGVGGALARASVFFPRMSGSGTRSYWTTWTETACPVWYVCLVQQPRRPGEWRVGSGPEGPQATGTVYGRGWIRPFSRDPARVPLAHLGLGAPAFGQRPKLVDGVHSSLRGLCPHLSVPGDL